MRRLVVAFAGILALAGSASAQTAVRPPEELVMPRYAVLGVPTGQIATDFATAVRPALESRPRISAAFLCWVRYGDAPQPSLALLIVGPRDRALMEAIGREFARLSGPEDSIDMIFIAPADAADVSVPPMYVRAESGR